MTDKQYECVVFGMGRGDDTKQLRKTLVHLYDISATKANCIIKAVRKDLREKRGEKKERITRGAIKCNLEDGIAPHKVVDIAKTWGIPPSDARSMVDQVCEELGLPK